MSLDFLIKKNYFFLLLKTREADGTALLAVAGYDYDGDFGDYEMEQGNVC
jgi:hypothetical protein